MQKAHPSASEDMRPGDSERIPSHLRRPSPFQPPKHVWETSKLISALIKIDQCRLICEAETSNKLNKCLPSSQYPLQTLLQPESKQKRRNQSHRMSCGSFRWSTRATASMLSTKHFLSLPCKGVQSYYNHKVSVPKMLCWGSEAKEVDGWSSHVITRQIEMASVVALDTFCDLM